jgi:hypothetical protein
VHTGEIDKLNKIIKTLEEELLTKVEKLKHQDSRLQDIESEK